MNATTTTSAGSATIVTGVWQAAPRPRYINGPADARYGLKIWDNLRHRFLTLDEMNAVDWSERVPARKHPLYDLIKGETI